MLRTRTFIVLAGAALVAVAITATMAFASGGRELSKPTTVRVEVRDGNEVLLSLNPNTNTFFGNQFVINGPLFKPGTQTGAGRAHGVCTFMDRVGDKSECAWTLYLRRGEVMLQGPVDFNLSDHTFGAIVGGTRLYRNARGQVVFLNSATDREGFVLKLEP